MSALERHYKTVELAGKLSLPETALRQEVAGGRLRAAEVDGELIFLEGDVLAWLESARAPSRPKFRFVYFIQVGDDGPIKIGSADDPVSRLYDLQTANHRELFLRAVALEDENPNRTSSLEFRLHKLFAGLRIRGEWFLPGESLVSYIRGGGCSARDIPETGVWAPRRWPS